jgi:hypothetical protein
MRHGERHELVTKAAAGIEHFVNQFAAGDPRARRDLIPIADKLGVKLAPDHNGSIDVVSAALAAEDEAIIVGFLRRHGVEL